MAEVPLIDVSPAMPDETDPAAMAAVAEAIDQACRSVGFFSIVGHGVDAGLADRLDRLAREFFLLPDDEKAEISMDRGGRAWRGWFPVFGELTSGRPDRKEGLYVGEEHPEDHPLVQAGEPLHGHNLFPAHPAGLGDAVMDWFAEMTRVGHRLMRAFDVALGLPAGWIATNLTADPVRLFRIFHYPAGDTSDWGVGEHTDYGLLTLLAQDDRGGLQVHTGSTWLDVPPVPGALVCNVGDMLELMTGGLWRSTPHRVRNTSGRMRLSFPFFFDPSWDAQVQPLPGCEPDPSRPVRRRWDGSDLLAYRGTYGGYLRSKVSKVFPDLGAQTEVLTPGQP